MLPEAFPIDRGEPLDRVDLVRVAFEGTPQRQLSACLVAPVRVDPGKMNQEDRVFPIQAHPGFQRFFGFIEAAVNQEDISQEAGSPGGFRIHFAQTPGFFEQFLAGQPVKAFDNLKIQCVRSAGSPE